ncbi:hypothetical protein Avbf_01039, partial [Armadillidium vulgare]
LFSFQVYISLILLCFGNLVFSASKTRLTIKRAPFIFLTLRDIPKNKRFLSDYQESFPVKRNDEDVQRFRPINRPYSDPRGPLVLDNGLESMERIPMEMEAKKKKMNFKPVQIPKSFSFNSNSEKNFIFPYKGFDINTYFHGFPEFGLFNVDTKNFVYE